MQGYIHDMLVSGALLPRPVIGRIIELPPNQLADVLKAYGHSATADNARAIVARMLDVWQDTDNADNADMPDDAVLSEQVAASQDTQNLLPPAMVSKWLQPSGYPRVYHHRRADGRHERRPWVELVELKDKAVEEVCQYLSRGMGDMPKLTADEALELLQRAHSAHNARKGIARAKRAEKAQAKTQAKTPTNGVPSVRIAGSNAITQNANGGKYRAQTCAIIAPSVESLTVTVNGQEISLKLTPCTWSTGNTGHRAHGKSDEFIISAQTALIGGGKGKPSPTNEHMITAWVTPRKV